MRDKAIPALTMIVAAGLIGLAQARLPRPIRDDRDGVNVEMSAILDWIPSSIGGGARFDRTRDRTAAAWRGFGAEHRVALGQTKHPA